LKHNATALALAAVAADAPRAAPAGTPPGPFVRGTCAGIEEGRLLVQTPEGTLRCEVLENALAPGGRFEPGDAVLVACFGAGEAAVVIGRIGAAGAPAPAQHVTLTATETLSLKCGESSIDLRADGKVMIRGDDVLVRAKGTQRIRAGTVSIN